MQIGIDPITLQPIFEDQPRTWPYEYLRDRQYDEFLRARWQEVGNGVTTELTFDPEHAVADRVSSRSRRTAAPALQPDLRDPGPQLHLRLGRQPDRVPQRRARGRSSSLSSAARRCSSYSYDPYERIVGGTGDLRAADKRHRRYELTLGYDVDGNVTSKNQNDAMVKQAVRPANATAIGSHAGTDLVNTDTTYSFTRTYDQPAPHQAHRRSRRRHRTPTTPTAT